MATTPDDPSTGTINTNQIVDKRQMLSAHGAILATKTSDTPVVNTTTETLLFAATVPAGLLAAGDIVLWSLSERPPESVAVRRSGTYWALDA